MASSLRWRKHCSDPSASQGTDSAKLWRRHWRPVAYWIFLAIPVLLWMAMVFSACKSSEAG